MTMEKGQPVPCAELLKALCESLKSALSFYKKFVKDIKEIGFKINPCDPCMANRMVIGKQQTTVWHADDVKVSHVDSKVNNKFAQFIKDKHEDEDTCKAKAICGKVHDHLGMTSDFSSKGTVKIDMTDSIQLMLMTSVKR